MDSKPRILLVDDDQQMQEIFKTVLEDEGYLVDCASSGKEAIQKTTENSYNVALLDINLPDINSVELIKLLKEPVPRTRKIMVTGYPTLKNAVGSLNNKADFYMVKPVDIDMLLAIVKEQLAQQKAEMRLCEEKVNAELTATAAMDAEEEQELIKS